MWVKESKNCPVTVPPPLSRVVHNITSTITTRVQRAQSSVSWVQTIELWPLKSYKNSVVRRIRMHPATMHRSVRTGFWAMFSSSGNMKVSDDRVVVGDTRFLFLKNRYYYDWIRILLRENETLRESKIENERR